MNSKTQAALNFCEAFNKSAESEIKALHDLRNNLSKNSEGAVEMTEQKSRFYIELPKCVAHLEVKLDMCIENGDSLSNITAEMVDEGGGAFLKLTMPDAVALDPEELSELNATLLDVCRGVDAINKSTAETDY